MLARAAGWYGGAARRAAACFGDGRRRRLQGRFMLFSIDYDHGAELSLYVVPDSGGGTPALRILNDGVELMVLSSNEDRPELIGAGRHSTGKCGFVVNESVLPGVTGMQGLDFIEAETGLSIYRRPRPSFVQEKIFRLETHLLPLWRIDDAVKDRFQYWYRGIDRRGYETSQQVFCIADLKSAYISGRLFIKSVEYYLNTGFKSIALFRDPYEELAERLIILKNVTPKTKELLGPRDSFTFEPVMDFLAEEVPELEEEPLRRMFKRAPQEVLAPLTNPLVRQLSCSNPDEMPKKTAIAQSLLALSSFEVVSLRSDATHFTEALCEMLGLPPGSIPVMNEFGRVRELAQKLKAIHEVEGVIDYDMNIFEQTTHAFGSIT